MSTFIRTDSDGNDFQVWAQRQASSCAAAAMWMAECQAKQMSISETEWDKALQIYNGPIQNEAPMTFDPRQHSNDQNTFGNQFSRFGTFASQLDSAFQSQGLTTSRVDSVSGRPPSLALRTSNISPKTPVVVLVGWWGMTAAGWQRNGGHFVVAVRVSTNRKIVYLDPWGGRLLELPNNGLYAGTGRLETALYIDSVF